MDRAVEYRGIPDFPAYRVGSDGSVWSRWVRGRYKSIGPVWRRIYGSLVHGHPFVRLSREDGPKRAEYAHRLVLQVFVGPCPAGMEGCHRDDVKTNNALSNLRWDTSAGNKADMVRHGRSSRGERSPVAKLTVASVRWAREQLRSGMKQKDIAARLNVTHQTISDVARGRRWGWLAA